MYGSLSCREVIQQYGRKMNPDINSENIISGCSEVNWVLYFFRMRNVFSHDSSSSGSQDKYAQVFLLFHHKPGHWHSYENISTLLSECREKCNITLYRMCNTWIKCSPLHDLHCLYFVQHKNLQIAIQILTQLHLVIVHQKAALHGGSSSCSRDASCL
jgi:hypothetical protein